MNKPTDAEIKDLYAQETGFTMDDSPAALLDFARAVLAKWGQPAHSGEPVAYYQPDDPSSSSAFSWPGSERNTAHNKPLFTAPQPVEREPLTPEQIKDEASHHGFIGSTDQLVKFVRGIEAAHGIKGGQHGAE